jgi:hypothetical protein
VRLAIALAMALAPGLRASAQVKYASGQNIAPVFEGWMRNADGTISMLFGYMNRNYEQTLDVPVGVDNQFQPGDADRGQPTHFLTRRQRFVFAVVVPGNWEKDRRLVWTVTVNGHSETANGWLQPEWEVDEGVIQMNIGPGGAPPDPPNHAPSITGSGSGAIARDTPMTLIVHATDDGIPKPRVRAGTPSQGRPQGLSVRWIQYRGPGRVTFGTDHTIPTYGQPVDLTTQATFSEPGVYVLRAIASDGLLETVHDVTVTVR